MYGLFGHSDFLSPIQIGRRPYVMLFAQHSALSAALQLGSTSS